MDLRERTPESLTGNSVGWSYEVKVLSPGVKEKRLTLSEGRWEHAFLGLTATGALALRRSEAGLEILLELRESDDGVTLVPSSRTREIECNDVEVTHPVGLAATNYIEVDGLKLEIIPTGHHLGEEYASRPRVITQDSAFAFRKKNLTNPALLGGLILLLAMSGVIYKAATKSGPDPAPSNSAPLSPTPVSPKPPAAAVPPVSSRTAAPPRSVHPKKASPIAHHTKTHHGSARRLEIAVKKVSSAKPIHRQEVHLKPHPTRVSRPIKRTVPVKVKPKPTPKPPVGHSKAPPLQDE